MSMNTRVSKLVAAMGLGAGLMLAVGCGPQETAGNAAAGGTAPEAAMAAAEAVGTLPVLGAAPEWRLTKIDGTELSSADLKGKVVVVDFWATWCPPCKEEVPGYIAMQKAHEAAGLVIVGVSLDQKGPPVVREFAEDYGINYPLVMGDQEVVAAFGGVQAIPTTFLIDREGQVRHRKVGMMDAADYEALVASLL